MRRAVVGALTVAVLTSCGRSGSTTPAPASPTTDDRAQAFLTATDGTFTADPARRLAIGHTVCDLFGGYPPDTAAVEHVRATFIIGLELTASPDETTSKPFINAAINDLCPQYGSYIR